MLTTILIPLCTTCSHDPSHTPHAPFTDGGSNSGAAPLSARGGGPLSARSYTPSSSTPTFWAVDGDHHGHSGHPGPPPTSSQKSYQPHPSNMSTEHNHHNHNLITSITTPRTYHDVVPVHSAPPSSPPSSSARGQGHGTAAGQGDSSNWSAGRPSGGFLSSLLHGNQESANAHLPMISQRLGLRTRGGTPVETPPHPLNLSVHSVVSHVTSHRETGVGHEGGGDSIPQESASVGSPQSTPRGGGILGVLHSPRQLPTSSAYAHFFGGGSKVGLANSERESMQVYYNN